MIRRLALIFAVLASGARADAPDTSARPVARGGVAVAQTAPVSRPVARPHAAPAKIVATHAAPDLHPPVPGRSALGFVTPTPLAILASARPSLRGGASGDPGYETITDLIADGSLTATADVPLMTFVAVPPGTLQATAPAPQADAAAAPMGLVLTTPLAIVSSLRPNARVREDRSYVTRAQYRANQNVFAFSPLAVPFSARPLLRPAALTRQVEEARAAIVRGSVCGDPSIQGDAIGDVPGPGSCGIDDAVRLRSVAGISFSGETPRVDCTTARALKRWIERGALPAIGNRGGGLSELSIMGTYSCRNRNGARSGRISEHAFGKAFDIGGFRLRDGTTFTVLRDWGTAAWGDTLKALHRAACGPFGTVLGPNANAAHRNHFHFDTAGYRSGSYCR